MTSLRNIDLANATDDDLIMKTVVLAGVRGFVHLVTHMGTMKSYFVLEMSGGRHRDEVFHNLSSALAAYNEA